MRGKENAARATAFHILFYTLCGGAGLLFAVIAASFILPLAKVLSPLFTGGAFRPQALPPLAGTIAYTFAQSLASTALALAIAVPAAWLLAKRHFPLKGLLASFSAVPLCIPALLVALGYIATFGRAGHVNRALMAVFHLEEAPLSFLYSFWGIVITQGFYNFPLIMMTTADAWRSLDSSQADSALLLGASRWRVFRTITAYQLLPAIISGCIPVFLYCFFSFMIVLLFGTVGGTTLEVAIYHAGRSALDFRMVAFLALVETSCAAAALWGYSIIEGKAERMKGISFAPRVHSQQKLSLPERCAAVPFFALIALFFMLPLFSIAINSFTLRQRGSNVLSLTVWKQLLHRESFYRALGNTLCCASATALLCTVTGLSYAVFLRLRHSERTAGKGLLRTIPLLPMAVSSVVTGIGLTQLVRRGTPLLLVIAQTSFSWPFAFRQLSAALSRLPQDTIDSARLLSAHAPDCVFRVIIPSCAKNILSSLGFCFAISAGDATLPLVLALYKFDTLALYTYRLAGSYRFAEACASGIVLGALCMGIFALANRLKQD